MLYDYNIAKSHGTFLIITYLYSFHERCISMHKLRQRIIGCHVPIFFLVDATQFCRTNWNWARFWLPDYLNESRIAGDIKTYRYYVRESRRCALSSFFEHATRELAPARARIAALNEKPNREKK